MLALLSPAKTLADLPVASPLPPSQPAFLAEAQTLVERLRTLDQTQLAALLKVSPALARLNGDRYRSFQQPFTPANAAPAALLYQGDTYQGLDAASLSGDDWAFADTHLGILSGLYGLLRPLDLIQPYRLEMGIRLANPRGPNLYDYWRDRLAPRLDALVAGHPNRTILNLASAEYSKAVVGLRAPLLTPHFQELRDGRRQVIGLLAKRARGSMARYLIDARLEQPEPLQRFNQGGYRFEAGLSDEHNWVFVRG